MISNLISYHISYKNNIHILYHNISYIMKLDLKNQFVEELDNIYKTHLIYRTIVVC